MPVRHEELWPSSALLEWHQPEVHRCWEVAGFDCFYCDSRGCSAAWQRAACILVLYAVSQSTLADPWRLAQSEHNLKLVADGLLTLMSFTILPDITTSSLSIQNSLENDPGLTQATLGGGFTVSSDFPLYLEGNLGWSRFDPAFVVTDGAEQRRLPVKWNSISATGGLGWDFPVGRTGELKLRPIFNFMLGRTTTDAAILGRLIGASLDRSVEVVQDAKLNAYGLGGSLMLDYEHYREDYEIDVELRYSNIQLRTFEDTTQELKGDSESNSAGIWARWRAPTGVTVFHRPLRYVLETSHTQYLGNQRGALGFDYLTSLGAGIEFDSTAYTSFITRTRLVGRYMFGRNISGFSVGLAVSF